LLVLLMGFELVTINCMADNNLTPPATLNYLTKNFCCETV
jgi:hypothetical protein